MTRVLGTALFAALSLLGGTQMAAADVLPPDACFNEGEPCFASGKSGGAGGVGVCTAAKCQRAKVPGEAGTGGASFIVYDCLRCMPGSVGGSGGGTPSGGTGGAGGGPSSGGIGESGGVPATGGAGGGSPGSSSGCDCGFRSYRSEHSLALLMAVSGLLLARSSRRQR